ncbi:MAG: 16S rRNA (cytosine(1402)-N(4))-methyltransferase, partial [Pseudomonadota bacterium]
MSAAAAASDHTVPHIPVLLRSILEAVAPVTGVWID